MGMNVNLTPQLEELVRAKVASGMYTSASEVVREALRLMDQQDRLRAAKLDTLLSTRPKLIATANIGCLTHLAAASPLPVRHWIELLDETLAETAAGQ